MNYTITIENLEFETIIGILEFERKSSQLIRVDMKISYERKENFIDYAEVVGMIKEIFQKEKFFLIEDALDFLENALKREYPQINSLYISVKKPQILKEALVGVEILRKY